jgi:hypothetical protein
MRQASILDGRAECERRSRSVNGGILRADISAGK